MARSHVHLVGSLVSRLARRQRSATAKIKQPLHARVEALELRLVLSSYELSPDQWQYKDRLTYSIVPDGAFWYHGYNEINVVFNAKLGQNWQTIVAEALSQWSSAANIDIAQVADNGGDGDWGGLAQRDSQFGDIRIGAYNFNDPVTLAVTSGPPPCGWTQAGDVQLNTGQNWNNGKDYDFYSVILHELGHSLGLDHASDSSSDMYERYEGVRQTLATGDIQGVQAIYGTRQPDSFNKSGLGTSLNQPIPVPTPALGKRTAALNSLSLNATGSKDYIEVQIPDGFIGTSLVVTASARSLSMLSPALALVDSAGAPTQVSANPGSWGSSVSLTLSGVQPGQTYRFLVQSAEANRFNVGSYIFKTEFQGGQVPAPPAPPTVPPPSGNTGGGSSTPKNPPATTPPPVTTPVKPPTPVPTPTPTPAPATPKPVVVTPIHRPFLRPKKATIPKPIRKASNARHNAPGTGTKTG